MEETITETEQAIKTANRFLERADNGELDPDGDDCMLSRQFLRAVEREMELKHRLEVVLPMAKGYAHAHQVGRNQEKIEWAEQYVNQITEKEPYPLKEQPLT